MNKSRDRNIIRLFILPPLFLYLLFVIYPVLSSLVMSFYDWRGIGEKKWIGLANYQRMLHDENFINAVGNSFKYVLVQVPVFLIVSILVAFLVLNVKKGKLHNFYRSSIFFPYILPAVAVAMLWNSIFNPVGGLLNGLLEFLNLGFLKREWLGQISTAFGSVVWVDVWISTGFYTLLVLSGILNIPEEIIEAAKIDGASQVQTTFRIILPMLKRVMQVVITFSIINSLKVFATPQVLTAGGPDRSTEPISLYIYEQAFKNFNFGYASALGVIFLIIVLIITMITLKFTEGDPYE